MTLGNPKGIYNWYILQYSVTHGRDFFCSLSCCQRFVSETFVCEGHSRGAYPEEYNWFLRTLCVPRECHGHRTSAVPGELYRVSPNEGKVSYRLIKTRRNANEPVCKLCPAVRIESKIQFWFESNLPLVKPNPQNKFQVNLPIRSWVTFWNMKSKMSNWRCWFSKGTFLQWTSTGLVAQFDKYPLLMSCHSLRLQHTSTQGPKSNHSACTWPKAWILQRVGIESNELVLEGRA
jgi:hypothetical protein